MSLSVHMMADTRYVYDDSCVYLIDTLFIRVRSFDIHNNDYYCVVNL